MNDRKFRILAILLTVAAFVLATSANSAPASAATAHHTSTAQHAQSSPSAHVAPHQARTYQRGTQSDTTTTTSGDNTTLKVVEKSAVHADVHIHGTLVEWLSIHFTAAQKHRLTKPSNCITSDGWNYYGTTAGQGRHWDHNMRLCRSSKSFTGWVKVSGGDSGSHCMNPGTPANMPPAPHVPVIKGPITETRSFAHFFEHLKATQGITLHVHTVCGPAVIDTDVHTKGVVEASALLSVFVKSKGTMRSFKAKLAVALVMSAKTSSKVVVIITCHTQTTFTSPTASAAAKACVNQGEQTGVIDLSGSNPNNVAAPGTFTVGGKSLDSGTVAANGSVTGQLSGFAPGTYTGTFSLGAPVNKSVSFQVTVNQCQVTTQHWVNISCIGFEEISGGGSMLIKCDVSTDDQSAKIALAAHSNDANSRVSGINCFSQGGSASCKGDGTYEFTVTGVNDGSTVLSSSVTATASANGVSATFTSDPFPVDPSGGGF